MGFFITKENAPDLLKVPLKFAQYVGGATVFISLWDEQGIRLHIKKDDGLFDRGVYWNYDSLKHPALEVEFLNSPTTSFILED